MCDCGHKSLVACDVIFGINNFFLNIQFLLGCIYFHVGHDINFVH
jgi:hypothetical protein